MLFWLISTLILLAAIGLMIRPFFSVEQSNATNDTSDINVYRDQLRELDADVARGLLNAEEAETSRIEISRRILAADAAASEAPRPSPRHVSQIGLLVLAALMAGAVIAYVNLGVPGLPDQPLAARLNAPQMDQEMAENRFAQSDEGPRVLDARETELLNQLRDVLIERPDDLQGHRLLVQTLSSISDFGPAWRAQEEVIRILGDEAGSEEHSFQAELMIFAAGGFVSREADQLLARALTIDPTNQRARYYSGASLAQNGRPELAMELWSNLVGEGPDAPWKEPVREQMRALSANTGIPLPPNMLRGPTRDDIENAQEMTVEERQDMIRGMVEGLSDRLATEGGTPPEWARLITALGVLGETERAKAIYQEALETFSGNDAALAAINKAAESLP